MRDSALKRAIPAVGLTGAQSRRRAHARQRFETLAPYSIVKDHGGRRRAHARQRFETRCAPGCQWPISIVGEELMRDSALKPGGPVGVEGPAPRSEKSSCATAL